jgi:hypothetical protein
METLRDESTREVPLWTRRWRVGEPLFQAAMSLTQLWPRPGKHDAPACCWPPVYDWFKDFATAYRQEAMARLAALT